MHPDHLRLALMASSPVTATSSRCERDRSASADAMKGRACNPPCQEDVHSTRDVRFR